MVGYKMQKIYLLVVTMLVCGCAESFTVFHSKTGDPIILGRRAYTYDGCVSTMQAEAHRLGATFRYVIVRGSTLGRSLLWPFEPGYACEAAVGQERPPTGSYPNVPPLLPQG